MLSRGSLYRKGRRARGLCAVAGCPEQTGEAVYRCHRHAAAHKRDERARELGRGRAPGEGVVAEYGDGSWCIRWLHGGRPRAGFASPAEASAELARLRAGAGRAEHAA